MMLRKGFSFNKLKLNIFNYKNNREVRTKMTQNNIVKFEIINILDFF